MADIIDDASEREEAFRRNAIEKARMPRYVAVSGNKGLCLNCDDPIGDDRLKVNPHAILCIDCARDAER